MAKSTTPEQGSGDLSEFVIVGGPGDVIFREGDEAADGFIVQVGRIELVRESEGRSQQVSTVGPGDVFGESAFFDGKAREVSARALSDFQAVRLSRPMFEQMVKEDPSIAVGVARRLAASLRAQRTAAADRGGGKGRGGAAAAAEAAGPREAVMSAGAGLEFVLEERELTVGRVDRATGKSPDVDLTKADTERSLSRRHAKILFKAGRFFVKEEAGVRNGTFVNGRRVPAGREVELMHGAQVRFGLVETVFEYRPATTGSGGKA